MRIRQNAAPVGVALLVAAAAGHFMQSGAIPDRHATISGAETLEKSAGLTNITSVAGVFDNQKTRKTAFNLSNSTAFPKLPNRHVPPDLAASYAVTPPAEASASFTSDCPAPECPADRDNHNRVPAP